MNNSYYNPGFNTNPNQNLNTIPTGISEDLPMEQSYVENILRLNKGKVASIYMTFPDSNEWTGSSCHKRYGHTLHQSALVSLSSDHSW